MKACRHLLAVVAVVWIAPARGQVVQTQFGRTLDANYNLASGRTNTYSQAGRAVDGNLYVTGQVTGGFQFRGGVGYVGANQLRLDLPSAGLDDFIRSSIGVGQLSAGRSYGPATYLSPNQTAMGVAGIVNRLNRPGTSVPRATYVSPSQAKKLYDSAMAAYRPIASDVGNRLRVSPLIRPLISPSRTPSLNRLNKAPVAEMGAFRPEVNPLFGLLRSQEDLQDSHPPEEMQQAPGQQRDGDRVGSRISATSDESQEPSRPPEALPTPGQDVFLDMLIRLREIRYRTDEDRESPIPGEIRQHSLAAESGAPASEDSGDGPDKEKTGLSAEQVAGQVVIHTLAGINRDQFNEHMTEAEKALANGAYYDAATHYDIARILDRSNPLALVGTTLALFAADEPRSSAFHLRRGFEQFPPLIETRVDINKLLNGRVVDSRITELERRLAGKSSPSDVSLFCLAAFVRSSMGQPDKAAEHAKRLKALAGDDKLYQAYAERLLGQGALQVPGTTRPTDGESAVPPPKPTTPTP